MKTNPFLAFVLLASLFSQPLSAKSAIFSDEHLRLHNVEVAHGRASTTFTGLIENTHPIRSADDIIIYIVLKQHADNHTFIIDILRGFPDDSSVNIAPGERRPFEVVVPYGERDFDDYTLRVDGALAFVFDGGQVTGEVALVEETLTWTWNDDGDTMVYGELYNGTNAVVGRLNPTFTLKRGGRDVGLTVITDGFNRLSRVELLPGQTVEFWAVSAAHIDSWDTYSVDIYWEPLRLYEDVRTGLEAASWGQIKNYSRVENAE
ncbi:MAG: hypothetical protein F4Z57_15070 [Gemmatimonadetes bacterium]|nr:hypothetical protein [Gemmatimonadota bacterium]MYC70327.1 hypothetical protein [Gemmatimonadota bacterium]MYI63532.1 hypothetical protein [Gemmatimonadota bacterium]